MLRSSTSVSASQCQGMFCSHAVSIDSRVPPTFDTLEKYLNRTPQSGGGVHDDVTTTT